MTTETRSVAEIMGWEEIGPDSALVDIFRRPDGSLAQDEPTPDDMLAFLREQGYNVQTESAHDATEVEVSVGQDGEVMTPFYDDTLHAALEAAVRAVAGEAGE